MTRDTLQIHRPTDARPGAAPPMRILAVGFDDRLFAALPRNVVSPNAELRRIAAADLGSCPLLGESGPGLILSPLLTPDFDAMELARYLHEAGYQGRYLAIARLVPDADMIRRDVLDNAPGISFDLVVLDGSVPVRAV